MKCWTIKIGIMRHDRLIGLLGKVFANGSRDQGSIPSRVLPKTQKMVLDISLITFSIIRHVSRVKWSIPRKGVVPFPTPQCSSYQKGNLLGALNYDRQIYLSNATIMKLLPKYEYVQCITKVSTPLIFLQIIKYISLWDNTDKMTLWHNEN